MQNKTSLPLLTLLALFILSCNLINSKKEDKISNQNNTTPKGFLLSNIVVHAFSDPILKDTFKLFLKGDSIVSGRIIFQIISHNNKLIYNETFPASDLLGDNDLDSTSKQKEDDIAKSFNDFFIEKQFIVPATALDSNLDLENVDKRIWNDIKSDPTAIGFEYAVGYETVISIAYSKKKKKVVTYFEGD